MGDLWHAEKNVNAVLTWSMEVFNKLMVSLIALSNLRDAHRQELSGALLLIYIFHQLVLPL